MIEGAPDAIRALKKRGIACRFLTNTSTASVETLGRRLRALGLPVERDEIVTTPRAAARLLRERGTPRCHFVLTDDARRDFEGFPEDDRRPEVIVLGDIGERWSHALLNRLFRMIMDGAELVALHKGRFWETATGLTMDIGAFVAGLEYVTGREATVIGKPSAAFFRLALSDLGVDAPAAAMVGDDIDSDVGGAQRAGVRGILVRTGKYREEVVARSTIVPDLVIDSIRELPERLSPGER